MMPQKIHFIFGLDKNFAGIPFSYYHYLAVKSAKTFNPDFDILLHYHYEPTDNVYWERAKEIATLQKIEHVPTEISGKKIIYMAHCTDLLRLQILHQHGGIYLDMDTICIKPFYPLLKHHCVMGMEVANGTINGLCNAVIISIPESGFVSVYLDRLINEFDPGDWNKGAVRDPLSIAKDSPYLIHVEPQESFFRTTWSPEDTKDVHQKVISFDRSYSLHLWETITYHEVLRYLTEDYIFSRETSYTLLARKALGIN